MSQTHYDSTLTKDQIQAALVAVHGLIDNSNNGKIVYVHNGKLAAKSARDFNPGGEMQSKTVTPSATQQVVTPDTGYDGLSQVIVNGDADLVAGNIKNGVDIFCVTGSYSGGGSPVLQAKTATQNGVVLPDSGYDGLSQVTVNVSGGGDVILLTRAAWEALTTAQKQAYGLVAIQDAATGFYRGKLVNGADYIDTCLPYSEYQYVICEAYPNNYNSAALSWGDGSNPIQFSASGSAQNADGSVAIKTYTHGTLAYVDLGAADTPFTAYLVAKLGQANTGTYTRELSVMKLRSASQGLLLYGNSSIIVSSWASDTNTDKSASSYFVAALQFASIGNAFGCAISAASDPINFISKAPSGCGRYITIGRSDIDPDQNNAVPSDMDVLYLGVTTAVETQNIVAQNMQYLAQQFLS